MFLNCLTSLVKLFWVAQYGVLSLKVISGKGLLLGRTVCKNTQWGIKYQHQLPKKDHPFFQNTYYWLLPYIFAHLNQYQIQFSLQFSFPKFRFRFYSRATGLLKFKIYAGLHGRVLPANSRRLVAFTFHPFYPLAISVQRNNTDYVVNFHIRHFTGTSVDHF